MAGYIYLLESHTLVAFMSEPVTAYITGYIVMDSFVSPFCSLRTVVGNQAFRGNMNRENIQTQKVTAPDIPMQHKVTVYLLQTTT